MAGCFVEVGGAPFDGSVSLKSSARSVRQIAVPCRQLHSSDRGNGLGWQEGPTHARENMPALANMGENHYDQKSDPGKEKSTTHYAVACFLYGPRFARAFGSISAATSSMLHRQSVIPPAHGGRHLHGLVNADEIIEHGVERDHVNVILDPLREALRRPV